MKYPEKKPRFDQRNYHMGEGQFFDQASYSGNLRLALLGILVFLLGHHLGEIASWLWHQFGKELVYQAGKMTRNSIGLIVIGLILIVSATVNLIRVFLWQRRKMKGPE